MGYDHHKARAHRPETSNGTSTRPIRGALLIACRTQLRHNSMSNFSCEPSFLLRGLSYMREICHRNVPNVPRSELATWMVAPVFLVQRPHLTLDRRKRAQALQ